MLRRQARSAGLLQDVTKAPEHGGVLKRALEAENTPDRARNADTRSPTTVLPGPNVT